MWRLPERALHYGFLGNKTSLERDAVWKRLLEDAEKRNTVTKAHSGFLTNYATASSFNSIDRTPKRHQMDGLQPKSKKQKLKLVSTCQRNQMEVLLLQQLQTPLQRASQNQYVRPLLELFHSDREIQIL